MCRRRFNRPLNMVTAVRYRIWNGIILLIQSLLHFPTYSFNCRILLQLPARIECALDQAERIQNPDQPEMVHSSSAHEVTNAFFYLKDVWRQMGWRDSSNPKPLLSAMVDVR